MNAPEKFAEWLSDHKHTDKKYGHTYHYHPRSDAHSIQLCTLIVADIIQLSPVLRDQMSRGQVAFGINVSHRWATTGKQKTIDLVIGQPLRSPLSFSSERFAMAKEFSDILVACEAKSVMTEHGKSQPRIFDELSSSHEIVHQGRQESIAAGITVVNIASTFTSPLRQTERVPLHVTHHNQPHVTESMVAHLRGLPIRNEVGQVGFDAYCTFVIECDNVVDHQVNLWTKSPAPQPPDPDHYVTFIGRLVDSYAKRFSLLPVKATTDS